MRSHDELGRVEGLRADGNVEGLLEALCETRDEEVYDAVTDAVVSIGAPALESLIVALAGVSVRQPIVLVLGRIGDARAVDPLIGLLMDSDEVVRSSAIVALGDIGDGRAVGPLLATLKTEAGCFDNFNLVWEALVRIGRSGLDTLFAGLDDESERVRSAAILALAHIGDPRAVEHLEAARGDKSAGVRADVNWALEELRRTVLGSYPESGER